MTPDVMVDIGNSRLKMGLRTPGEDRIRVASLRADYPNDWTEHITWLSLARPVRWAVASVHPKRLEQFVAWVKGRREELLVLGSFRQLPLDIDVDTPPSVGIDRLINAVAAKKRLPEGVPGIIVDAGTAMTVDLVDRDHVFRGGAILPGPQLMANALHTHTAKLPAVELGCVEYVESPGKNTEDAIRVGIRAAITGATAFLIGELTREDEVPPWLFLTGGSLGDMAGHNFSPAVARVVHEPALTLDGIRIAAEALP